MMRLYAYYLKKRLPVIIIITFLLFVLTLVYTSITNLYYENGGYDNIPTTYELARTYLGYLTVIMCIFVSLVPIFEYSFKMKRTSIDVFYSLPIKRRSLFITKYLIGLTEILFVFIVLFGFIVIKSAVMNNKYNLGLNIGYHFIYFGIGILLYTLLYSYITFFFTRTNNVLDGIINIVLASLVLLAFMYGVKNIVIAFSQNGEDLQIVPYMFLDGSYYTPYSPIIVIANYLDRVSLKAEVDGIIQVLPLVVMLVLSLASIVGLFVLNPKIKGELTGDITNDYFSYKVLIPVMILSLLSNDGLGWILIIIIAILGYILYVIKNRSFKIKKDELITLIVVIVVGIAINIAVGNIQELIK